MELDTREKAEFLLVGVLALGAEIAVKLVPIQRLTRFLGIALVDDGDRVDHVPRRRSICPLDAAGVDARTRLVDQLYRSWPRKNSCLRRALVLGFRIRGANPVLLIGVAKEDGKIRAHAWIEVDDQVIGERGGDFAPLRSNKHAG